MKREGVLMCLGTRAWKKQKQKQSPRNGNRKKGCSKLNRGSKLMMEIWFLTQQGILYGLKLKISTQKPKFSLEFLKVITKFENLKQKIFREITMIGLWLLNWLLSASIDTLLPPFQPLFIQKFIALINLLTPTKSGKSLDIRCSQFHTRIWLNLGSSHIHLNDYTWCKFRSYNSVFLRDSRQKRSGQLQAYEGEKYRVSFVMDWA